MNIKEAANIILSAEKSKMLSKYDKVIIKKMLDEGVLDFENEPINSYRLTNVVHFLSRIDKNELFDKWQMARVFIEESERCLDPNDVDDAIDLLKVIYPNDALSDKEWGKNLLTSIIDNPETNSQHLLIIMGMFINEGEADKGLDIAKLIVGKAPSLYMAVVAANEIMDWFEEGALAASEAIAASIVQKALDDKVESNEDDLDMLYDQVKSRLKV